MTILSVVILVMMVGYQNELSVYHRLLSIVWLLEQICSQTKECKVHQFVPNTNIFKTICEHTLDNSPTVSSSSLLKLWSSRQRVETLYNCSVFLFASSQNLRKHFVRMSSLYPVTSRKFLRVVSPTPVIFRLLRQWFVIRTSSLYSSIMFSFGLHSRGVHPKHTWSGNDVASPGSTIFIKFSPFSTYFLPSSSHVDIIHVYQWE